MDRHNTSRNKGRKAPRARFHDYRAPGYYFITLTTYEDTMPLSEIRYPGEDYMRKDTMILPYHTPLGNRVREALERITTSCHLMRILRFVIMPDHIHFVLNVTKRLENPIGTHLARFSKECSAAFTNLAGLPTFTTLFTPFDDEIIFNFRQLDRAIKYTEDNPRRYLLRRMYPDLFRRYLQVVIGDHEYAAFGNIFLLRNPYLLPVRIHRRWSHEEFDSYIAQCRKEIDNGATVISPAIHKVEKEIFRMAIDSGSSVILLRDLSFDKRFKPQGELFDLCAEGRLLMLSPWPDNLSRRSNAGFTEFHQMNDFAAQIASISPSERLAFNFRGEQKRHRSG